MAEQVFRPGEKIHYNLNDDIVRLPYDLDPRNVPEGMLARGPGASYESITHRLTNFVQTQAQNLENLQEELKRTKLALEQSLSKSESARLQDRGEILSIQMQMSANNLQRAKAAEQAMGQGVPPKEAIGAAFEGEIPTEISGRRQEPQTYEEYENNLFAPKASIPLERLEADALTQREEEARIRHSKRQHEQLKQKPEYRERKIKELLALKDAGVKFTLPEEQELNDLQHLSSAYEQTKPEREAQGGVGNIEGSGLDASPNMPPYLVGSKGALYKLLQRAYRETIEERPLYMGERIAEFQPLQREAEKEAFKTIQAEDLQHLFGESAKGLKRAASTNAYEDVSKYLNPSLEPLMELMERRTKEDFANKILPPINANFIAKGAYRSGARQKAIEQAEKEMRQSIADQRTQLLGGAYDTALGSSIEDLKRRGISAAQLQDLKAQEHEGRVKNVHLLDEIGKRKQALEQEKLTQDYRDWLEQMEQPMRATERFGELVRGLPSQTKIYDQPPQRTAPQQNPSLASTLGGTLLSLGAQNAGMGNMFPINKRAGGRVKKADGGLLDNDYENRLISARDRLDAPSRHHIWDFIENLGMGIASSRSPTVKGAIQEGLPAGLMGSKQAILDKEARRDKALSLSGLLEKSRMDRQSFKFDNELKAAEAKYKLAQAGEMMNPGPSDSVMTTETTGPFVVTKKGNRVTHIGGKPVVEGMIQEGGESSYPSTPIPPSEGGPRAGSFLENKLHTQAQAERDKAQNATVKSITDINDIISAAKDVSNELPSPAYQGLVKKYGYVKNLVGEESKAVSDLETYSGSMSQLIGLAIEKLRGLGAMSNTEFENVTKIIPDADKQPTARANLLNILDGINKRFAAQVNAREAYMEKFGTDKGFDKKWMNYLGSHPAYGYNKETGRIEVNKNNLEGWQSMFSGEQQPIKAEILDKNKIKYGNQVFTREQLERIKNGQQ